MKKKLRRVMYFYQKYSVNIIRYTVTYKKMALECMLINFVSKGHFHFHFDIYLNYILSII